jgi:hypothetical protein
MAFDYDIDAPLDGSYIADFPPNARLSRTAIHGSVNYDHFAETSGHHRQATLDARGGDPSTITTESFVYSKITGGITELFYMDDQGKVTQLTIDGSASPDKMPLAGGEFSGDVTFTDADLLVEGTSLIKLLNAKYLQGRDQGDAAWRDLIGVNSSDEVEIGDASLGADGRIYVTDEDGLVVNFGSTDYIVWNKSHFASAPVATVMYESLDQTVVHSSGGNVAHNLGFLPSLWTAHLRCTSSDNAYAVGDVVPVQQTLYGGTPNGLSVWGNATHFGWETSNTQANILEKAGDGANANIDYGDWKLVFRGWY